MARDIRHTYCTSASDRNATNRGCDTEAVWTNLTIAESRLVALDSVGDDELPSDAILKAWAKKRDEDADALGFTHRVVETVGRIVCEFATYRDNPTYLSSVRFDGVTWPRQSARLAAKAMSAYGREWAGFDQGHIIARFPGILRIECFDQERYVTAPRIRAKRAA